MAIKIGPSFAAEVKAALGHCNGMSWNPVTGELTFQLVNPWPAGDPNYAAQRAAWVAPSAADQAKVIAAFNAHDPTKPAPAEG